MESSLAPFGTPSDDGIRPGGFLEALGNPSFRYLWVAQAISQIAQNATIFVLLVLVERETHSSFYTGLLLLSALLPTVLFGMAAGVFVDRWPKRRILVTTNLLRVLAVMLFLFFPTVLPLIFLVSFAFGTISQFFAPAEMATVPSVVERRQLIAANGLFNLTFSASQLLGFILVGPAAVKSLGLHGTFVLLAVGFAIAAVLVRLLPELPSAASPRLNVASVALNIWHELIEGVAFLRRDSLLLLAIGQLTVIGALLLAVGTLAPGYAARVVGASASDAFILFGPAGVGIIAGIVVIPRLSGRLAPHLLPPIGLFVSAGSLLLMALAGLARPDQFASGVWVPILWSAVLAGAAGVGIGYALVNVPAQTLVQTRVPEALWGRVFATQVVLGHFTALLPLVALGHVADRVGIPWVAGAISAGLFVAWLVSWRWAQMRVAAAETQLSDVDRAIRASLE